MKKDRFAGKVVAVTGSGRGIGKNIAYAFGQEGANVIICDVNELEGKDTESELQKQKISANFLFVDLSHRNAPQKMVRQIVKHYGSIDVLINNARTGKRTEFLQEDANNWDIGMTVMLKAAFFASQEAVRFMSNNGGGSIVNISSISGKLICNESPVYHIAKAGLIQMTRYLAVYAGIYGVSVNAVLPGFIVQDEHRSRYERDNNKRYREIAEFCHPLRKVGKSDDVANAVLFLCSSEASFITGHCIVLDGGLTLQDQSNIVFKFNR